MPLGGGRARRGMSDPGQLPAYGGPGWESRQRGLREELGGVWAPCGVDSEWGALRSVLLHRPGREVANVGDDPRKALMVESLDPGAMRIQHDALAQAFRANGVEVHYMDPPVLPPPNQLFAADLLAMTPEGAILARPASPVRAGEERWAARALSDLGVPILRTVRGQGTFEGADLMWLAPDRALLAQGLRTNGNGAEQVEVTLREMGVEVHRTRLPQGTMHLMGQLRILDRDLAVAWGSRIPRDVVALLKAAGFALHFLPDEEEALRSFALNFVTLAPGKILMPSGNPSAQSFYEDLGVECVTVEVSALGKAAGSIGCLTGILWREPFAPA